MEIIQAMAGAVTSFLIVSAILQVIFAFSLQVIAEKTEETGFTAFLAWIPGLNLYTMIKCGGGSFVKFLLGFVGGGILLGVGAAFAGKENQMIAIAVLAFGGLAALVYMARIVMNTADRRGLSKWVGLLTFVPVAGMFAYPVIAFHDGFQKPNWAGLALGCLLAFGPLPAQIMMINAFTSQAGEMAESGSLDGMGALLEMAQAGARTGEGAEAGGLADAMQGMSAAMEVGATLAMLEGMDPADPQQAEGMREAMIEIRKTLGKHGATMGPEAASEFDMLLTEQQMRLAGAGEALPAMPEDDDPSVMDVSPMEMGDDDFMDESMAMKDGANDPRFDDPGMPVARDTNVADRTGGLGAPPASPAPITAGIGRDGSNGFAVPADPGCRDGAVLRGAAPPDGFEQSCERTGANQGMKHGWHVEWHANGARAVAGEYRDSLRVGVWTRWYPTGVKRVQAEFREGLQDGSLIAWDDTGMLVHEGHFEQGAPADQ